MMGNHEASEEMPKSFPQYEAERFQLDDEYPVHKVRITHTFYMGVYAVTVGEFRKFVDAEHYATDAERNDDISSPPGSDSKRSGYRRLRLQPRDRKARRAAQPKGQLARGGLPSDRPAPRDKRQLERRRGLLQVAQRARKERPTAFPPRPNGNTPVVPAAPHVSLAATIPSCW